MKTQFSILVMGLLTMFTAWAGGNQKKGYATVNSVDTLKISDSSISVNQPVLGDPKKGFYELYLPVGSIGVDKSQLNPRAISFVEDYMAKHTNDLVKLKDWGRPYFDMMDNIFIQHGLPKELKYIAVIESHLKTYAVSWVGAVGPWQFMPATARRMGLRVNDYIDERTDYYKSTTAAAKYLSQLFDIYKDWLLVIAAYNGGPGNVNSAIRRAGSRDFWTIQYHLPTESRNHVKKFIATHYILEGEGGITTLTKEEARDLSLADVENPAKRNLTPDEMTNSKTLQITGRFNAGVVAKHVEMDMREFNRYNPDFDHFISTNSSYELRLPVEKMTVFVAKRYDILNESLHILINTFRQSLNTSPVVKPVPAKKAF